MTSRQPDYIRKLRARADELGMFFEMIASLPGKDGASAFESTVAAAREAGALAIRCRCLPDGCLLGDFPERNRSCAARRLRMLRERPLPNHG